jgi:hypothetical protein
MRKCIGNTKHNFKPLSDTYCKYKPQEKDITGYNYKQREEYNPGVGYVTLFCSACGLVIEVISTNNTNKELHNDNNEEIKENEENIPSENKETTEPEVVSSIS